MDQRQEGIVTIRTLPCDICERFDSILLTKDELEDRVNRNSLHIGSRILSHNDHLRIIYFDIDGEYLGDTMSLNISNKSLGKINPSNIPYLLDDINSNSLSIPRKMLRFLRSNSFEITIVGPSLAGKTSLTILLETGIPERSSQRVNHAPTMGQSIKRLKLAGNSLTIFDMGGQEDFWHLWDEKINQSDKVIFVLDACANNYQEIKEAFQLLIAQIDKSTDLLIMFNKLDLYFDGYSDFYLDPGTLFSNIDIPTHINYWVVQTSVYNGCAYTIPNDKQLSLSKVLTKFFER